MPTNDNKEDEHAHLERINSELNQSMERCRDLLKSHRSQLAANSNEEPGDDEGEGAA